MRLRDDPDALRVLVEKVVQKTTIPRRHIEKDFWLTEALRRMAAVADAERFTLLFKGGTSLSKAFRIIDASRRMSTCSSSCRPQARARRIGCCVA
jgi:predicted nucleotidyltransferase component of viral defense system